MVEISQEHTKKPVFYVYDEAMLLHTDHNYHNEEGALRTDLPELSKDDFASPETPLRLKAIHTFL